jgi:peptidyl-prolyl cis-trans isomerase D
MTMMISKFHKLIQSKLLWGVFATLIIFSFVVWGSGIGMGGARDTSARRTVGTLNGRKISESDLRDARAHVYLSVALATLSAPRDLPDDRLREAAIRRLVLLDEARRMKLQVGEEEVLSQIREIPLFQQNGAYQSTAYTQFVRGFLEERLGLSESFFLDHVRQEILMQRVRGMATDTVIVPPIDSERVYQLLHDRFTVEYARIPPSAVEASVVVTEEEARAFFETDPARYLLPPQVEVEAAFFDLKRYSNDLPDIEEADIADYYEEHQHEFVQVDPPPAAPEGEPPPEPTMRTRPLDEVRPEIIQRLHRAFARYRAELDATRMVGLLAGDRGAPLSFEAAAQQFDAPTRPLPPFSRTELPEGVRAGPEFAEAAFALTRAPGEDFSSALRAENGVYVLRLLRRIPPREPAFEEVADRIRSDARQAEVQRLVRAKADALKASGGRFAQVAEGLGFDVQRAGPFTLTEGLPDLPFGHSMLSAVVYLNSGEIADPIPQFDGSVLVVRVVDRQDAPIAGPERAKRQAELTRMLANERERDVVNLWEEDLVARRWTEARKPSPDRKDEEPAPDADESANEHDV